MQRIACRIVQRTHAAMLAVQYDDMINAEAARKMVVASTLGGDLLNRGRMIRHINNVVRSYLFARQIRRILWKGALDLLKIEKASVR